MEEEEGGGGAPPLCCTLYCASAERLLPLLPLGARRLPEAEEVRPPAEPGGTLGRAALREPRLPRAPMTPALPPLPLPGTPPLPSAGCEGAAPPNRDQEALPPVPVPRKEAEESAEEVGGKRKPCAQRKTRSKMGG